MALSHSGTLDASLNDYGSEAMEIYACGNDLCCDLFLLVFEGFPTNEPTESSICCALQGLVEEEERISSTICEPYEGGVPRVKVEGISSSKSLSSLSSLSMKEEGGVEGAKLGKVPSK